MITFENTSKGYRNRKGGVDWIFRNVSATFPTGVSVGILAPRGQGKTTLIQVAAGNETPSEGRIFRKGRVSWPFTNRSNISGRLTGKQNLRFLTDVYGRNFGEVYDFVSEFSELGRRLDMPLSRYSMEMRVRLSISALLAMNFNYMLIDDALTGGNNEFRRRYINYIDQNSHKLTFLIATSNPLLVTKYCTAAGVLNNGELRLYDRVADAVTAFNRLNPAPVQAVGV